MGINFFEIKRILLFMILFICFISFMVWNDNKNRQSIRKVTIEDSLYGITIRKKSKAIYHKGMITIGDSLWISETSYSKINTKIKLRDITLPFNLTKKAGISEIKIITKKDTMIFVLD